MFRDFVLVMYTHPYFEAFELELTLDKGYTFKRLTGIPGLAIEHARISRRPYCAALTTYQLMPFRAIQRRTIKNLSGEGG